MELLQVADIVAREKNIGKDEVLEAMEVAIQKAARSKYGQEHDIRATINRKSGDIELQRYMEVVEAEPEDEAQQISLADARKIRQDVEVGAFLTDPLPPIDFGRIAAQTAKQVITQKVRDAERRHHYEEYKDRVGQIVNGVVKRLEYNNVMVDLERAEAILRRDQIIPREHFKIGDRIRAYIFDVRPEPRGPQIFLSRAHPDFMARLFEMEVPEIYDGIIEIKAVARDPGSRAKIAVFSHDPTIDPVGACVGMRGSRVQAVVGELQGEKVDIVPWSSDVATFVVNALAPAEVSKVVIDDEQNRIDIVVPDSQLSLAIGRRGQNVRLAGALTGWEIDILTEAEESERRNQEVQMRSKLFIDALDVDEVIAHVLVQEGFRNLKEIAFVPISEFLDIEGFDEELAAELQRRAREKLDADQAVFEQKCKELAIAEDLQGFADLTPEQIIVLAENQVKNLDDLADLASDELLEILPDAGIDAAQAEKIIMSARAHWFAEDAKADEIGGADADVSAEKETAS